MNAAVMLTAGGRVFTADLGGGSYAFQVNAGRPTIREEQIRKVERDSVAVRQYASDYSLR